MREQSLKTIREAIKNKTLTCYRTTYFDIAPLYLDATYNTKCVVGCLIPDKELEKYKDKFGNVSHLWNTSPAKLDHIEDILANKNMDSYRGLTVYELAKMQRLHDKALEGESTQNGHGSDIEEFEIYISSL